MEGEGEEKNEEKREYGRELDICLQGSRTRLFRGAQKTENERQGSLRSDGRGYFIVEGSFCGVYKRVALYSFEVRSEAGFEIVSNCLENISAGLISRRRKVGASLVEIIKKEKMVIPTAQLPCTETPRH